jgi:hypothetical protein
VLRNAGITKWHLTILLVLMALRSDGRGVGAGCGGRRRVGLVVNHFLYLLLLVATPMRLDVRRCNALNLGVDFFLLFTHQIQVLLSFLFPFRSESRLEGGGWIGET